MVLHELRAPLGFLITAARAAAEECEEGGPVLAHVRVLERAATRLLASAEQVLTVALADRELVDEPFEPDTVAANGVAEAIAVGQPVRLVQQGSCGWVAQSGNAAQLDALVQSLLNNAIQHGPRDGEITVTVSGCDSAFSVEVRNRLSARSRSGLGVGSDVCARLAERLGGELHGAVDGDEYVARFTLRAAPQQRHQSQGQLVR